MAVCEIVIVSQSTVSRTTWFDSPAIKFAALRRWFVGDLQSLTRTKNPQGQAEYLVNVEHERYTT